MGESRLAPSVMGSAQFTQYDRTLSARQYIVSFYGTLIDAERG